MAVNYIDIADKNHELPREEAYAELMQTTEWLHFRESIIKRDEFTCTNCGKKSEETFEELPFNEWHKTYTETEDYNIRVKQFSDGKEYVKPYPSRIIILDSVILQVHHKLYFADRLPWNYNPKFLTTLCIDCHKEEHRKTPIYTYDSESMNMKFVNLPCSRCNSTGYIEEYSYYKRGVCFSCGGQGILIPDKPVWENV